MIDKKCAIIQELAVMTAGSFAVGPVSGVILSSMPVSYQSMRVNTSFETSRLWLVQYSYPIRRSLDQYDWCVLYRDLLMSTAEGLESSLVLQGE